MATYALRMELVVTRRMVPDASFDDATAKLREVKEFADDRGLVAHFAIGISQDIDEKEKH